MRNSLPGKEGLDADSVSEGQMFTIERAGVNPVISETLDGEGKSIKGKEVLIGNVYAKEVSYITPREVQFNQSHKGVVIADLKRRRVEELMTKSGFGGD